MKARRIVYQSGLRCPSPSIAAQEVTGQQRTAFGSPIANFQNTRFKLADLKSDLAVGWAYADQCLHDHINHELTISAASTAKLWITEMRGGLVDQCLQLFGGYGYMRGCEIAAFTPKRAS